MVAMEFSFHGFLLGLMVIGFSSLVWRLFYMLVFRPYNIQKVFAKQGINGPSYNLLYGSLKEMKRSNIEALEKPMKTLSHDTVPRVLSSYHNWSNKYGEMFLFWEGVLPRLVVTDADMVRDILSNKFGYFDKTKPRPFFKALIGKGLALVNGEQWAKHRRVLNPAFHIDRLKAMTKRMAACTMSMLEDWGHDCKEIEVHQELKALTANIIAHTAFGSSYAEGKAVFQAQTEILRLAVATSTDLYIPGSQFLPTKNNRRSWELEKTANNTLRSIINSRIKSCKEGGSFGDDLLGMMLESSRCEESKQRHRMDLSMSLNEMMDECKTFFFAGHETTANLLTWTMFLLSIYPEWQKKLRAEVKEVCAMDVPDADMVAKLKLVTMVLLETLRLYSPVTQLFRVTTKDMNLGGITIPKDTGIALPMAILHRKKEYWGDDADEFNPLRFSEGISKAAKHPNAMIPFSIGPRNCIGQNFAMIEARVVLSMILQRFSFSLSPNYKHAPSQGLLQPQFGVPIILEPL